MVSGVRWALAPEAVTSEHWAQGPNLTRGCVSTTTNSMGGSFNQSRLPELTALLVILTLETYRVDRTPGAAVTVL